MGYSPSIRLCQSSHKYVLDARDQPRYTPPSICNQFPQNWSTVLQNLGNVAKVVYLACVVGEEVEVVMVHPRASVHAAVQERVVLITEETTLLYGPGVGS